LAGVAPRADELQNVLRNLVGVDLVSEQEQGVGPTLVGLAHHAEGQNLERVTLVAVLVGVGGERIGRLVRDRDAARPVEQVELAVRRDRADDRGREIAFGPGLPAVQENLVLVGLPGLQARYHDQSVVMPFDLEGSAPAAEDFDLAG
jgi:hypothetical protein